MKRTVLFIGYDIPVEAEIEEYVKSKSSVAYFARSNEQAIRILDEISINTVILNLRNLNDAVILRYVNRYYPDIHVVISANKEFDEMISIFNHANYARLPGPFRLEELGAVMSDE
jgi:hypothetical protein